MKQITDYLDSVLNEVLNKKDEKFIINKKQSLKQQLKRGVISQERYDKIMDDIEKQEKIDKIKY